MVINMDSKIGVLSILAILCVLLSACAVCATESTSVDIQSNDQYLDASHDGHDGAIIPPDYAHDEAAQHAAGGEIDNATNSTVPAGDNINNATGNNTNTTNSTPAAGGDIHNSTSPLNATAQNLLHSTGNPILALLAVGAVLGGVEVLRRR